MSLVMEPEDNLAGFQLTKDAVADLSADDITEMPDGELVAAIQTVADQVSPGCRVEYLDRRTLETMTFLARRCCRNEGHGCVELA